MVKVTQYWKKHNLECLKFLFLFKKYSQFLTGDFWKPPSMMHKESWQQFFFFFLFPPIPILLSWNSLFYLCAPLSFSFLKPKCLNISMNLHHKMPWNQVELCVLEWGMNGKKRPTGETEIAFHGQGRGDVLEHREAGDCFFPLPNVGLGSNRAFSEKPSLTTLQFALRFLQSTLRCWSQLPF